MKRRKFIIGAGALTFGTAAAVGTGAYQGADVEATRSFDVGFTNDTNALLTLQPTSQFASLDNSNPEGGAEFYAPLTIDVSRLNVDADTRLNEVFRVQNTTGAAFDLEISYDPDSGYPFGDPFKTYADDGSTETRIDDGSGVTVGAGESVGINLVFEFAEKDANDLPETMILDADGAQ